MRTWSDAFARALVSGSAASVASSLVLAAAGRRQDGHAAAPTNATSHWLWGDGALHADHATLRHTAVGYAIHHIASLFWATAYEKWARDDGAPRDVVQDAALTAAVACVVDYTMTPRRFTPGFEKRLRWPALAAVYLAFGAGLAGATLARRAARSASPRSGGRRAIGR